MVSASPTEYASIVLAQVQPFTERLRAYQRQMNDIGAEVQINLSHTADQHLPETSRTAAALADEVARRAAEETERVAEPQKAAFESLTALSDSANATTQDGGTPSQQASPQSRSQGNKHTAAKNA